MDFKALLKAGGVCSEPQNPDINLIIFKRTVICIQQVKVRLILPLFYLHCTILYTL